MVKIILPLMGLFLARVQPSDAQEKKDVIVLCDFTTSIDSVTARANMKRDINALFGSFTPNTRYYFYSVGNFLDPILEDSVRPKPNDNLAACARNVSTICQRFSQKPSKNSCLVNCFNMVSEKVRILARDRTGRKCYLVILSDMLEACREDNNRWINLENGVFSPAEEWLSKWQPNSYYYADLPNLDIEILLTTNKAVYYDRLKTFWSNYFKKMGYRKQLVFGVDPTKEFFTN